MAGGRRRLGVGGGWRQEEGGALDSPDYVTCVVKASACCGTYVVLYLT